ncbi:MAG: helical backbone metal receptor [Actinomycetota bacterium]|nr:helical backbone metal receptor [Actinomycetota bacterium]
MRIVSLVPSVTDTMAALGVADRLVGVTDYCVAGAPSDAARVGGTKNPAIDRVLALRPDLVIANSEENRPDDLDRLRDAGVKVAETFVQTVDEALDLVFWLGEVCNVDAGSLLDDLEAAQEEAERRRPATPVVALTLIWRRPWRGVGADTYVDDLLRCCGFANALAVCADRYPGVAPPLRPLPQVVLLPSEPYRFTDADLPAVAALTGDAPARFVDGQLLTWHGARTGEALRRFSALAGELAAA